MDVWQGIEHGQDLCKGGDMSWDYVMRIATCTMCSIQFGNNNRQY